MVTGQSVGYRSVRELQVSVGLLGSVCGLHVSLGVQVIFRIILRVTDTDKCVCKRSACGLQISTGVICQSVAYV